MSRKACNRAKRMTREELERRGIPFDKLTARTVDFTDLARDECVFVRIHGWQPSGTWDEIRNFARNHGFRVET